MRYSFARRLAVNAQPAVACGLANGESCAVAGAALRRSSGATVDRSGGLPTPSSSDPAPGPTLTSGRCWFRSGPAVRRRLGDRIVDLVVLTTGSQAYRRLDGIAVVPLSVLGP